MNPKRSDPAALIVVFFLGLVGLILLLVLGLFVVIPILIAFIGWRVYVWHSRRPMDTQEVLQTAQQSVVERIPFPSVTEFTDNHVDYLMGMWKGDLPIFDLCVKIGGAARTLYEAEEVDALPELPTGADAIQEARYRDKLLAYIKKTQDTAGNLLVFNRALAEAFSSYVKGLSSIVRTSDDYLPAKEPQPFAHAAILDLIEQPGKTIDEMFCAFFLPDVVDRRLFATLRKQIDINVQAASHAAKKDMPPKDYKGSPRELLDTYLVNTPLRQLFAGTLPFNPADEVRFSGHWIVGSQGKGKTTLLTAMLMQDFEKDASVIIMDGKGDLIDQVSNLDFLKDRYVVIDPRTTGINPLDVDVSDITQATERLEYVFSALLEAKITPLQAVLFRNVLRALVTAFPDPTLATFQDLLLNGFDKYKEYIDTLRSDLKDFFYKQFNRDVYVTRRGEVLSRLDLLLTSEPIRNMMLVPKTNFSIAQAMDAGKVIIINNSVTLLGEQGAEFLGRYFVSQIWAAATARSGRKQEDKKPCYFYIDEAHRVIKRDEKISQIIDECRSQRLALILAHQRLDQIESPNVVSALSNCALRYANTDIDARTLANHLRTRPEFIYSLKVGQFAAFVRDVTPSAIAITVQQANTSVLPKMLTKPPAVTMTADVEEVVDAQTGEVTIHTDSGVPTKNSW